MEKINKYDEFNLDIQNVKVDNEVLVSGRWSATYSCNTDNYCNTAGTCINGCSERICAC